MEVSLSGRGLFLFLFLAAFAGLVSCGNRYDLSTERGRQSRIDDANFHLSKGECGAAAEAIDPLYNSTYVNDEVRIIKASAVACNAHYNLLTFVGNIAGVSNYFQAMAKSLTNTTGDGARQSMYDAVDVLTQSGAVLNASQRSASVNTYMVFLQFGVISAIIRNYGNPSSTGARGANLIYDADGANPSPEMSDIDACALAAAFSHISDSMSNSNLSDSDTKALNSSMNSVCVSAGFSSCAVLSRDRTSCNGVNANSVNAKSAVTGVNASW